MLSGPGALNRVGAAVASSLSPASAALNLDFTLGTLDDRITFTRASQATLFDSTGTLKYAKHNLLTYSEEFDNAAWGYSRTIAPSGASINAAIAPNGEMSADLVVIDTTSGTHSFSSRNNFVVSANITHTYSIYLKTAGARYIIIQLNNGADTDGAKVCADLVAGTITAVTQNGTATGSTASITSVGNGWYRISISVLVDAVSTTVDTRNFINNTYSTTIGSYVGDGTSGIYIWGAQLNLADMEGGVTGSLDTYYPTTTAAYYAPRFDYNPSTLAPRGLLIEEQRANLCLQSEDLSTTWTLAASSITTNAAVAPDGNLTADKVVADSTSAFHGVNQSIAVTSGVTYTFSVYAKASGYNFLRTGFASSRFGTAVAYFDLANGTVGTVSGVTATISSAGNGWYRCSMTATCTSTGTSTHSLIYTSQSDNQGAFTGDNSSGLFAWGAQLEAGAFATSYIPTTTTALTRNADVASMTGTNFSDWYSASEGTVLTDFSFVGLKSVATQRIITIDDGSNTNFIAQSAQSNNTLITLITTSSSSVMSSATPATTFSANTQYKMLIAYKQDDSVATVNGTVGTVDTSNTIPTVTTLRLAASSVASTANCWYRRIAYYPTRLSNAQLQALTA
jgi:hypothetical protein